MNNTNRLYEIIKELNDDRSKLSALYSLYNSSLLSAEEDRQNLSSLYEQMIDFRNDVNQISNTIFNAGKTNRVSAYNKSKSQIKAIDKSVKEVNTSFNSSCKRYKIALKDCGSLKTEYKHAVSELCKEFKSLVDDNIDPIILKGYRQQVKIIKAILDKIEFLVAEFNVKRNNVESDNEKFAKLYDSVNQLLIRLQQIA